MPSKSLIEKLNNIAGVDKNGVALADKATQREAGSLAAYLSGESNPTIASARDGKAHATASRSRRVKRAFRAEDAKDRLQNQIANAAALADATPEDLAVLRAAALAGKALRQAPDATPDASDEQTATAS